MEGGIFQSDLRGKGRKTCVFSYVCTCIHLYIVYIYIYIYIYMIQIIKLSYIECFIGITYFCPSVDEYVTRTHTDCCRSCIVAKSYPTILQPNGL